MKPLALAVATSLGVGYIPVAPGTFGSLAGLVVWWLLPTSLPVQLIAIVVTFAVGTWSASLAEKHFSATDPGPVVIAEVLGMLVTLAGVGGGWQPAVAGFFLFRIFDIIKPYPANKLEQLHGGLGIMADDGMAAIYGNVVLRIVLAVVPRIAG
jgi:phosphatidylglycerophosphatase A